MFKLIITILFLGFSISAIAQTTVKNDTSCSFLKNIKFKNGVDTVVVKVTFVDINPLSSLGRLDELKENGVDKSKFIYQLVFKPENCSKEYIGASSAGNINRILKQNPFPLSLTVTLYITCVAFNKYNYDNDGTPYFVVIKITTKKPRGFE